MRPVLVLVTVDVENPQTPLYEKRFADNRIWEVERILDIFEAFGVRGAMFTNVYEHVIWGRGEMERLVQTMHNRGHQVELHTHPIWVDPKRREHMFQFSLAEQKRIIRQGAEIIGAACGRRPLAHRAGAYAYNRDTLRALADNGLVVDSSNFFGHPNCRALAAMNQPEWSEGILEAPVTFVSGPRGVIKTDLDWLEVQDFQAFLEESKSHPQANFLNLFMHSYSLLHQGRDFSLCKPDQAKADKLKYLLEYISEDPDLCFITVDELPALYPEQ